VVAALLAVALAAAAPPAVVTRAPSGLTQVTSTAAEPARLYLVEQRGLVRIFERGKLRAQPFLDTRGLVSCCGEQGLLSIAFHPRYAQNHRFYVDYTDSNGDSRVVEYRSNGRTAIPSSARQLMFEDQPYPNHNGGQLAFGPDGLLYIGLGDGGSGGDPNNNGQTFTNRLAKIYKVNVDQAGAPLQLVAYGLRNPWRFSFDRATGDLYIGDVGQNAWEEVDFVAKAQLAALMNFGWSVYEGRVTYDSSRSLDPRGRLVWPVAVYSHSAGCSVTGGFVYRGKARPDLAGRYFYGDYCSGTIWSMRMRAGKLTTPRREGYKIPGLTSFGEDARGGLYAVTERGVVYRIAG
jgi:glucose/arabinose dehydrogenase